MSRNVYYIEKDTGEYCGEGKIYDIQDIQNIKKGMDIRKSEDEFKKFIDENLGSFYFLFYKLIDKGISRQYITRFLYLSTYMNYENKLVYGNAKDEGKYMLEKDLIEVFKKLSSREVSRTKNILLENELIVINNDNTISINERYCIKGKIQIGRSPNKVRVFNNGFREIYLKSDPREHKQLGLLFEILPYIHKDSNIVCYNPREELREEVIAINLKDICEMINYNKRNSLRLKEDLKKVTVNNEPVFSFTEKGKDFIMCINPRVYYKGGDIKKVWSLIAQFDAKN